MKVIVYLPGLGYDYSDISGYNYAERYMSALDKMNPDKNIKYLLEKKELKYGFQNDIISQITSIYEYDSNIDEKKETHRIYEYYYADSLTEKFNSKNIIVKLVLILFTLFSKSIILIKTFFTSQFLNMKKRIEAVYFFSILSLIAVFAVILFPAILTSITGLVNQFNDSGFFQINQNKSSLDYWMAFSYWVTSITALLTTIIPDFRSFISNTATEFLCLDYYLTISDNKLEIIGKLEGLIERISENDNYSSIEIHGYSFGSIILIDSIFSYGNKPALRLTKEVKRIVTIGCPHDFISTFYPSYFTDRALPDNSNLKEWLNIYSEIDILSSNFRPDDKEENGKFKLMNSQMDIKNIFFNIINPKSLNFWSHIGVIGIRAHKLFWGKGVDSSSCLNMLIEKNNEKLLE